MIKEYVGTMYREGCRDEAHEVEVKHGDGCLHGVCDICGEQVEHFDVGELVVEKCDMYEIEDAAIDQDWVVMGKHLICPKCKEKIAAIKGDIKVVEKCDDTDKLRESLDRAINIICGKCYDKVRAKCARGEKKDCEVLELRKALEKE